MKNPYILEAGQIEARYEELRENEDGLDEVETWERDARNAEAREQNVEA